MPSLPHTGRRRILRALASLPIALTTPGWSQSAKSGAGSRTFTVSQIVDTSTGQIDVTEDSQAFARRSAVDLGGFRIAPEGRGRGTAYVTQSMVAADGRLEG